MKKCLFPCLLILFSLRSNAQLGISVAPINTSAPDWQVVVENFVTERHTDFLQYGVSATVDYTIQLPDKNWRIQPAIYAARTDVNYVPHHFDIYTIGIQGNISYAPFIKDATTIDNKKAILYFQLSPGISYIKEKYESPIIEDGKFSGTFERFDGNDLAFNIGLNILLEWQLSRLLSVAPVAGIRYFPNIKWDGIASYFAADQLDDSYDRTYWRHFSFGLRMGLNLKAKK